MYKISTLRGSHKALFATTGLLGLLLSAVVGSGCQSAGSSGANANDEAVKKAFDPGNQKRDPSTQTAEQKAGYEAFRKNGPPQSSSSAGASTRR